MPKAVMSMAKRTKARMMEIISIISVLRCSMIESGHVPETINVSGHGG